MGQGRILFPYLAAREAGKQVSGVFRFNYGGWIQEGVQDDYWIGNPYVVFAHAKSAESEKLGHPSRNAGKHQHFMELHIQVKKRESY